MMGSIWNGFENNFILREIGVIGAKSVSAYFCIADFPVNIPSNKTLSYILMANQYSYFNGNVVKFRGE